MFCPAEISRQIAALSAPRVIEKKAGVVVICAMCMYRLFIVRLVMTTRYPKEEHECQVDPVFAISTSSRLQWPPMILQIQFLCCPRVVLDAACVHKAAGRCFKHSTPKIEHAPYLVADSNTAPRCSHSNSYLLRSIHLFAEL
jgi:hypothetical protein